MTATITSSFAGGERLPMFPGFGFEELTWPRILNVLVRGFEWRRKPQSGRVVTAAASAFLMRGIGR